jgi:hypothetical protein
MRDLFTLQQEIAGVGLQPLQEVRTSNKKKEPGGLG